MTECAVAPQRSRQTRIFRKFETLVSYLKGIAISRFEVDAANYDPDSLKTIRRRPDQSVAMKSAHEAVVYNQWLKAEIQESIDDTRPPIPHEQVSGTE